MDLTIIFKAIFLGIIEGLTEFIPVSSTAHLLLSAQFIDFSYIKNDVFEIVIQIGAILAVCVFYRKKIFNIVSGIFHKKSSQDFSLNILIAFLPSVIFGLCFYKIIKEMFFNPTSIAIALIVGGIAILIVERMQIKPQYLQIENLSKWQSFKIGLFQIIAMIPGVSRSGATIIGGLLLKLDRKTSTEFSFFLAIPTIFAASIFDFYKNYESLNGSELKIILIGFLAAFFSSLIIIKWFINFVSNHNFAVFAYYRIILGTIIILATL
ncbi:MAG: undecaprenyl-diphosphatase [Rickettsiales bacterium]|jgi:undecaprenyl-diphosphatase